jgi:hypothetical protein
VHVRPVVGLVVAGVQARALGADRVLGAEVVGDVLVLDDLVDLAVDPPLGRVVGLLAGRQVDEGGEQVDQAAALPRGLEDRIPLGVGDFQRRPGRGGDRHAGPGLALRLPVRRIVGLAVGDLRRTQPPIACGQRVRRGALEDGQVVGLLGDDRDGLDAGRAGTDDADPLPGQVDALMRPVRGQIGRASERLDARDLGQFRRRQAAGRHHQETGGDGLAVLGADQP